MTQLLDLPQLVRGLPPEPPAELFPALDAASRCFTRHGITRTSMTDIGREAGVSRSTIYRLVGSVEQAARLLLAREVHELLNRRVLAAIADAEGPGVVLALVEEIVTYARAHPVLTKVLADEPEIIGPFLVTDLAEASAQIADMAIPIIEAAMDGALIRRADPQVLAHWLVRLVIVLIIDPPPTPLRAFLEQILLPALEPEVAR